MGNPLLTRKALKEWLESLDPYQEFPYKYPMSQTCLVNTYLNAVGIETSGCGSYAYCPPDSPDVSLEDLMGIPRLFDSFVSPQADLVGYWTPGQVLAVLGKELDGVSA
jgi:hypothetical protein